MTTAAIHQPQYLPYLGFFHKVAQCDVLILLDDVQFQKNGLQNRNKIKARCKEAVQWLTVPVQQKLGQKIKDTRFAAPATWPHKHWSALVANYGRAPAFAALGPELRRLLHADYDGLCALNVALLHWLMEMLEIRKPTVLSSSIEAQGRASQLLIELCRAAGADTYLSGPGGASYMDTAAFASAGIRIEWQQYQPIPYTQQFPEAGFIPNLSAVDAVLNCGKDARRLIEAAK